MYVKDLYRIKKVRHGVYRPNMCIGLQGYIWYASFRLWQSCLELNVK